MRISWAWACVRAGEGGGEGGQRTGSSRERARWMEERRVVCDEIGSGVVVDEDDEDEVGWRLEGGGKNTGV